MYGVTEEDLIAGLDAIRRRLCGYGASLEESCDCKFGIGSTEGRPSTEQTGCPELRQAIKMLQGRYEEIAVITLQTEQSAARVLRQVVNVLTKAGMAVQGPGQREDADQR